MSPTDQDKIKVAREYFIRADEGRADILELFHEDAEIYFPNSDLDSDANRFSKWLKGSQVPWITSGTTMTV